MATDPPPPSQIHVRGGLHGYFGYGDVDLTGGLPSATFESLAELPVTGTRSLPLTSPPIAPLSSSILTTLGQPLPSMNSPLFTGESPQLWKTLCGQYFQMFSIHDSYRVPMAILNFLGPAGI